MTRVILDATGVRALLDQDPEFFGELSKNAAAQVAEQFAKRTANISERVGKTLDEEVGRTLLTPEWRSRTLTPYAREIVNLAADRAVREAVGASLDHAIDAALSGLVENLDARINTLVRNSLRKALA